MRPRPAALAVPQAFPYQGSKRAWLPVLLPLIPAGAGVVEPFAGSAAVSVGARAAGVASRVWLSDVNEPLMRLWQRILTDPGGLAQSYEDLWAAQQTDPAVFYARVRERFNTQQDPADLLFLLSRCVKASVRYNRQGLFNQSADRRRLGARPGAVRARIGAVSTLLAGAVLSTGSFEPVLARADGDVVVYLDPPYQGTSGGRDRRYAAGVDRAALVSALADAHRRGVSVLLSYDAADGQFGDALPGGLRMLHRHVRTGRSSQATLLGRDRTTTESLYVSEALVDRLGGAGAVDARLAGATGGAFGGMDGTGRVG